MKKIIFLLMMLFSIVVFTEKLTTDGKNHIDKLVGNWSNSPDDIITIKRMIIIANIILLLRKINMELLQQILID